MRRAHPVEQLAVIGHRLPPPHSVPASAARYRAQPRRRFHHGAHQSGRRVEEVLVGPPVVGRPVRLGEVGPDVVDRRLQAVEPVVEPAEVGQRHDALVSGHVELVGPAPGLVGPLAVGRAAEPAGPPRTRSLGSAGGGTSRTGGSATPVGHAPTVRPADGPGG